MIEGIQVIVENAADVFYKSPLDIVSCSAIIFGLANKILLLYFLVLALWFYLILYVFYCPKSIDCTERCYQIVIIPLLSFEDFRHIPI